MLRWVGILCSLRLFDEFPTNGATRPIMDLEECSLDEMLGGRKEDFDFLFGDDACAEQFLLGEDIARVVVFTTPGIERVGNSVSASVDSRGPWGRRGGRFGTRRHIWISVWISVWFVLPMRREMAEHGGPTALVQT